MSDESWRGEVGHLRNDESAVLMAEPHIVRLSRVEEHGWADVIPCPRRAAT